MNEIVADGLGDLRDLASSVQGPAGFDSIEEQTIAEGVHVLLQYSMTRLG